MKLMNLMTVHGLWQYMVYFNDAKNYLADQPALFSDEARVAEAAAVAQKLRKSSVCRMASANLLCFFTEKFAPFPLVFMRCVSSSG